MKVFFKLKDFFNGHNNNNKWYSIILLFINTLVLDYFISVRYISSPITLKPGDIADKEIKLKKQIEIVDEKKLEQYKKIIADTTPRVFVFSQEKVADFLIKLNSLKKSIYTISDNNPTASVDKKIQFLLLEYPWLKNIKKELMSSLFAKQNINDDFDRLKFILLRYLESGIMEDKMKRWKILESSGIFIRKGVSSEKNVRVSLKNVKSISEVKKALRKDILLSGDFDKEIAYCMYEVAKRLLVSTLIYNKEETEKNIKDKLQEKMKPIIYKAGQVIARPGDSITMEIYRVIQIINRERGAVNILSIIGSFFLILAIELILSLYINKNINIKLSKLSNGLIIFSLVLVVAGLSYLVINIDGLKDNQIIYGLLIPSAIPSIVLFILFSKRLGAIIGLFISFYILLITNGNIESFVVAFSSVFLSLIGKRDVHKRSEIWKYSYNVFIGYAILSIVFAVMRSYPTKALFYNLIISGLNSIMTGIIVIGLFPIYENLFDITTSFKLLEFSDLNSSLMRELMLKAPGTYQHSLMVANLAERAASEINANALLTKIGAYYHDIGKMKHPEYFVENQKDIDDSIHNKVSPKISSTMIISHIKYGIELAKSYGLPDVIINFIPEHHGTSLVKYFYHKALEHSEKVSKEEFMYPGPKPKSKETAIVMLADSIEAASRTLQKTTTQKIKELVTKIITSKINDGQLDECELTMKDIKKLSISFKDTLLGIYHQRIEYPEEKRDGLK